ncbi:BspA family leucine-rich repeat surface protein [uncultured Polaribacter sp.]|uniref:BspA family leucine-rich repeat surface protein n=1 Tax=uncultured Polaribacter sp. TaxID=174711 RepID=UPI00260AC5B0|nr:BspA family leucine-rich repeat surface protein [uncultured Polaribacter sp.]
MILKQLLLTLILFTQSPEVITLDDNGVTLKCSSLAEVGKFYQFNDKDYLIVDNELLKKLVKDKKPLENVITTFVTDMSYLFYKNKDFNDNIGHWDVSNVTSMTWMFGFCDEFNADISNWNTENVTFFNDMFHGTKNFNVDISEWNVGNGILFNGMFFESFFNKDINSWDVSKATNLSGMFDNAMSFNKPLSNWDVSNVKLMGGMFAEAIAFNQDISMWNVSKVTDMTNMFRNAVTFEQDLSSWKPRIYETPRNFNFNSAVIGPSFKKSSKDYQYWFIFISILLLVFIFLYWKKNAQTPKHSSEQDIIIEKLKNLAKSKDYILKSELDKVFNIEDLDYEKQKVKRAMMIRDINAYNKNLINRERDPDDKRSFLYRINY